MKSLSLLIIVALRTAVASCDYILRYYEAKIVIDGMATSLSGAYATISVAYNLTDCDVLSSENNCGDFLGIITSCYLIGCNNGASTREVGSAVFTDTYSRDVSNGILIPVNDVKLKIKRLALLIATAISNKDVFIPVVIVNNNDIVLLSASGALFNVSIEDEKFITYSIENHDNVNNKQPDHDITKGPLYYITLFMVIPFFIFIILVMLSVLIMSIIWMCRKCLTKVQSDHQSIYVHHIVTLYS